MEPPRKSRLGRRQRSENRRGRPLAQGRNLSFVPLVSNMHKATGCQPARELRSAAARDSALRPISIPVATPCDFLI